LKSLNFLCLYYTDIGKQYKSNSVYLVDFVRNKQNTFAVTR